MRYGLLLAVGIGLFSHDLALAFHKDGAKNCAVCHSMHNSRDGAPADVNNPGGNFALLRQGGASEVCLGCHAQENGAVFAQGAIDPSPEKGAGNFIFLTEDNLNDGPGGGDSANFIPGDAAGHNINAPSRGLFPDLTLTTSPGGSFDASQLGCTSCHDPHGNSNFRMLHGAGPIQDGLYTFVNPAPMAQGMNIDFGKESDASHTAYHSGMSAWCANCHADFHNTNYPTNLRHPSGAALGAPIAALYSTYNGTDDPYGGDPASAYSALVPFEDTDTLNTTTSTRGPSASSRVMCLSCHRAHASSAPDAGRWDFNVSRIADDGQASGSYPLPNPYGESQRSLCNKCHVKDASNTLAEVAP